MATDFEDEGLLKGTRGKAREARRELLEELDAAGVPLEELRRAVQEDRLALLPVERVLEGEGERYTAGEVAERAEVDEDFLVRQRQALGLSARQPEDRIFTDEDVEAARGVKTLLDVGLSEDQVLEATRVIGIAMSQVAASNRSLITPGLLQAAGNERDVARAFAEAARNLGPVVGEVLQHVLRMHTLEQIRTDTIGRAEIAGEGGPASEEVTACFADLVGFTRLGEELPPEELGAVTGRLAAMAGDVIKQPVRLVKMIGDAAMLVAPETDAVLDSALDLIRAAEEEGEEFPMLRAGVARGPALTRGGDWYGRPVNLASRITGIAYPSSVLTDKQAREDASRDYRWSEAGRKRIKGFEERVPVYRVRPADQDGDAA